MSGFKLFCENDGGYRGWSGNFSYNVPRAARRFTPPSPEATPPLQMMARMSDWKLQVYSYILHLADADELIAQNNAYYIPQQDITDLHPKAVELLINHHVIGNQAGTINYNGEQIQAYSVDVAGARNLVSSHANMHQFVHGVKNAANNLWGLATQSRLPLDPSITNYQH